MISLSQPEKLIARNPVLNVVVLAAVFNLLCVALIYDARGNAHDQAKASSSNLVASVSRDISRNIEIIDLTIQRIIGRVSQPDFSQLGSELQRQLLFDQVATAQYFAAIAVADEKGRIKHHSRFMSPEIINVAKNQYFTVHRDSADVGFYVSLPIKSSVGLGWGLVFSRRLSHPDGRFAGIAYVSLSLDYFTDLFRKMDLGSNGSMSLMRADKKLLVREPFNEKQLGIDVSKAEIYRYYPEHRSGSFEASSSPLDGVPRLYTFTQIGEFPIILNVGRSLDDVYGVWQSRALTIGAIVLMLTGAMMALALSLRRELRRRRAAHQEALHNEALFRGAMKGAGIGTALLQLDGTVFKVNPAFCGLFGFSEKEMLSKTVTDLTVPGDDLPNDGPLLRGEIDVIESEQRLKRKDGTEVWVFRSASLLRDEIGRPAYMIVQYQDITARREAEERLRYSATHDELTGLLNRSAFEQRLEEALAESRNTGIKHALAFVDLDRLKFINDSAGHAAGDALLRGVAGALPGYLREADVIGRLGGDEFGIILLGCSLDDARAILEEVNAAASAIQFPWGDRSYSVGASIGVAEITPSTPSTSAVLAQADVACLTAKMAGRNRVSIYRPEQSEAVDRHREIGVAAGIRLALEEGRFLLFAQRIVACADLAQDRYEILVRMVDRDGAIIPPSVFIPAAERYDLIRDIDRWVVQEALSVVGRAGDLNRLTRIHLNLSAASIGDASFVAYVREVLENSGVAPEILAFEITETAVISNMAVAATTVGGLREMGCQIALDDFGVGLSSFNYLRQFPVDIVKIDGSFVLNMTTNAVDRYIVRSIHQIAQELGAQTVAEFVKDQATFELVSSMGLTFAQGYAIHRPEPFDALLADHATKAEL
ncbi:EAL domain-containing protein [Microvirga guangxiensis]|uniref:PAS domain S-box-containing protein/diguanylate cyclase (GGDEF) domain-containing protein n=1 Tax=Microvirga guangxiensis TaxID=549386 RepID=A0A1G5KIT2_9HYPH|nr:EAL domain-containing protein [Microvirga guangxiensis]SCZ00161.1 PAS domain S-box-containing protein/diguanylate cyclase (GGDEF) domain-containing protein [Microvirga guangxiensis]